MRSVSPFSSDDGTTTMTVNSVSESIKSRRATELGFMKSSKSDVDTLIVFFLCKVDKAKVFSLYLIASFFKSSSSLAAID
jgi:hypothetical protein